MVSVEAMTVTELQWIERLALCTRRCVIGRGRMLVPIMNENNYYAWSLVSERLGAVGVCNLTLCLPSVWWSVSIKKLSFYWTTVCRCCLCDDRTACIARSIDCRDVALEDVAAAAAAAAIGGGGGWGQATGRLLLPHPPTAFARGGK